MFKFILKELLFLGIIINVSSAEIDSSTADAISQVRFVQYQPLIPKKLLTSVTSDGSTHKELDAKESGYYGGSVERPAIKHNKLKFAEEGTDDKLVPKNYAFSYAIRDRNSGDDFSHTQAHNGEATKGQYRVKLPDGRVQVVTYTADNGGYRADIRYDKEEMEEQPNNGAYISKSFPEEASPSIKQSTGNTNLEKNFAPKLFENEIAKKKMSDKISDSPLLYFNEIRSFGVPSSTRKPASYETVENTDEEQFPYSKKLLADVNYLLKYVTPTIDAKRENNQNFADFSRNNFNDGSSLFKDKFKEDSHKEKYQLPVNFPYKFDKFEEPKFEKFAFNSPTPETIRQDANLNFLKSDNAPRLEVQRDEPQKYDGSKSEEYKFDSPLEEQQYQEGFEGQKLETPNFDTSNYNPPRLENSNYNKPRLENPNFDNSKFNLPLEGPRLEVSSFENSKYDNSRPEAPLERPNFEIVKLEEPKHSNNYERPNFNSQQFEKPSFETLKYESQGYESPKYDTRFNSPQFVTPATENEIKKPQLESDPQFKFAKIEIPQYIHIHRYEASGEDQSNNNRPKELIYYNPLQIPVPNSMAYMEHGNYNLSSPQYSTFTPSYITMTEHPRMQPTEIPSHFRDNIDIPDFSAKLNNLTKFHENYLQTTPARPISAEITGSFENVFNQNNVQINAPELPKQNENSYEDRDNYENTIGALPPFDPRTYSGYFDFLPSAEEDSDNKAASPPQSNYPSTTEQADAPKELPQYYYDFSTASPINKYVSSAETSQEFNGLDSNQIRNATFLASAYLRPLHKERVYIHHNSQPTTPVDENYNVISSTTIGPRGRYKEPDVQIVKSISSTIPPELLKDFDYELSSSIFASRSSDNHDAGSEPKERTVTTQVPKLNRNIVKKLQAALSTNGKVYLKSNTQQKRVVR